MLIQHAQVSGGFVDVRIQGKKIAQVAPELTPRLQERVIDAEGALLLPGLHDHHIHLLSLAAQVRSVDCGPPVVTNAQELRQQLRQAGGEGWIRGVGYHESVNGELTADGLDQLISNRPVRIQHRSGKIWYLNTLALEKTGIRSATGQLFRSDSLLRTRLSDTSEEILDSLAEVSTTLASYGVTGVTDATYTNDEESRSLLRRRKLKQSIVFMGSEALEGSGHLKIMLDDASLPPFEDLELRINNAHMNNRPVAFHCVTKVEIVYALSAVRSVGSLRGDRIEHASVVDSESMALIRELGLTVVTQPNFLFERGRQYLNDVDEKEMPYLYRGQGFLDAGVPLGAGTDAPYGDCNPWVAIHAAVVRKSADGFSMALPERLSPERAIQLFCSASDNPGGLPRQIVAGVQADLCLLNSNRDALYDMLKSRVPDRHVRLTIAAGEVTYASSRDRWILSHTK